MLGEVVGGDEGQDVHLEAFQVVVVEVPDRGVLDGAVHPLGLAIGSGMVGLGEPMLDAIVDADAAEDVTAGEAARWAIAIAFRRQHIGVVGDDLASLEQQVPSLVCHQARAVGTKHIRQHIGIDRDDHFRPRSCSVSASVLIFLPSNPYTSLTVSARSHLIAICLPPSSLNSSTVPGGACVKCARTGRDRRADYGNRFLGDGRVSAGDDRSRTRGFRRQDQPAGTPK